MAYFHGPWFVTPREIPHYSTHMFYKQECFLSTISDSNPLLSVVGRCCVLESKDYIISRPTQYKETDVYICESIYDESKRMIRGSLDEGLKQYEHSEAVQADEVYFFKHPITVQKVIRTFLPGCADVAVPVSLMNLGTFSNCTSGGGSKCGWQYHPDETEPLCDGSGQWGLPRCSSFCGVFGHCHAHTNTGINQEGAFGLYLSRSLSHLARFLLCFFCIWTCFVFRVINPLCMQAKGPAKKHVTPYIVYSSDIRKKITEEHKNCSFGDISRLVGEKVCYLDTRLIGASLYLAF